MKNQPPESELQFDLGSTDDSLDRMRELFARHGDVYRTYEPGRKSWIYVVHHPDDVKRVLDKANDRFIATWEAQATRGDAVNVTEDMSELTLEIVLEANFSKDLARLAAQPGSRPRTKRNGHALPSCLLLPVRGTASARLSRSMKC